MFGKKKPKLDHRVRFQHRQFTDKLDKARQFKRVARALPDNQFDLFLSHIGLGSRWTQLGIVLLLLAAVYIIYIPNALTTTSVVVNGLSDSDKVIAEAAVRQSITSAAFYNPQHNLLFLSGERVKQAVLSVPQVYQVESITKDYANQTVVVEASPKVERFLIKDLERVYDVYNDGELKGQSGLNKDQWVGEINAGMIKLRVDGIFNGEEGEQALQPVLQNALEAMSAKSVNLPGATFGYVLVTAPLPLELPPETTVPVVNAPLIAGELHMVLYKKGDLNRSFVVIVDGHSDISAAMDRLQALLSQTTPDRYNNISYVDMRIEDRGFICLVNTPCDK